MFKIINYEKDIIFKTKIGEICSISLEQDFNVEDNIFKGSFNLSGEYKPNNLSVNKETFNYDLPLEYELDDKIDKESIIYEIDNFEYNTVDDVLSVYIDLRLNYEEVKKEPIIPEPFKLEEEPESKDIIELEPIPIEEKPVIEENIEEDRLNKEEQEAIIDSTPKEDTYIVYHIHKITEMDTLESIAKEYNTSVDMIKEYNEGESFEINNKLIIPCKKNE